MNEEARFFTTLADGSRIVRMADERLSGVKAKFLEKMILVGGCCLAFGAAFANIGVVLRTGISVIFLGGVISGIVFFYGKMDPIFLVGCGYMIAGVLWSIGKHVWFPEMIREMTDEI